MRERTALLALARGIADSGVPLVLRHVSPASPVIDAIRVAYRGRGIVLVHPEVKRGYVSISAYPTSMRGVSQLATDVFHFGFNRVSSRFRLDVAA